MPRCAQGKMRRGASRGPGRAVDGGRAWRPAGAKSDGEHQDGNPLGMAVTSCGLRTGKGSTTRRMRRCPQPRTGSAPVFRKQRSCLPTSRAVRCEAGLLRLRTAGRLSAPLPPRARPSAQLPQFALHRQELPAMQCVPPLDAPCSGPRRTVVQRGGTRVTGGGAQASG